MELKPLLYILFVIIWLLYKQYSKVSGSGKKSNTPKTQSVWDQLLEGMQPHEEVSEVQVPKVKNRASGKKSTIQPLVYESLEDLNTVSKPSIPSINFDNSGSNTDTEFTNMRPEFDLRSAVIADAILNRPYK